MLINHSNPYIHSTTVLCDIRGLCTAVVLYGLARALLNYTQTWACPYAHAHGRLVSILHLGAELLS